MLDELNKNDKKRIWMNYEASLTPYGCARLIEKNEPLQSNLVSVSSYILDKFFVLCHRKEGIHLFININPKLDEIHYVYRRFGKSESVLSNGTYKGVKETGLREWLKQKQLFDSREVDGMPKINEINEEDLKTLLKKIGFAASNHLLPDTS